MMSTGEVIQLFLTIAGGISIIGGAAAVIWKWITPAIQLNKKVEIMEDTIQDTNKRLDDIEKMQKTQSKCLAAILNHMITGNGIEHMREIQNELLNSIIDS